MPSSIARVATTGLRELWFIAGLLFCFGAMLILYLTYLVQSIILHLCTTGSVSSFHLWDGGRTFCLQRSHGKTAEGSSCVSIFLLFLNMWRIDFLYILLSGFLFSLLSLSYPPSRSKSVHLLLAIPAFHGIFCYMPMKRKQEGFKWRQEKENRAHPVLNMHRTGWSWGAPPW